MSMYDEDTSSTFAYGRISAASEISGRSTTFIYCDMMNIITITRIVDGQKHGCKHEDDYFSNDEFFRVDQFANAFKLKKL